MKMAPKLHWIDGPWPGRLAVAARPRGGDWLEDEIAAWKRAGVEVIVSLLTPEEAEDLGLTEESSIVGAHGIRYESLPIPDREIPAAQSEAVSLARRLAENLEQGRNVVVHCRQGIGRSASIAAGVFAAAGIPPVEALRRIAAARGLNVPETDAQREWIDRVAPLIPAIAPTRLP